MKWFTADWHLNHENIIDYCNRPFKRLHRMHSTLISNYNKVVADDDDVYFLGDLTIMGPSHKASLENFIRSIPKGRKHLIMGNHDKFSPDAYVDIGFLSIHYPFLQVEEFCCVHDPAICQLPDVKWICGHVHNLFKMYKNIVNVCAERFEYFPASIEEIRKLFAEGVNIP